MMETVTMRAVALTHVVVLAVSEALEALELAASSVIRTEARRREASGEEGGGEDGGHGGGSGGRGRDGGVGSAGGAAGGAAGGSAGGGGLR